MKIKMMNLAAGMAAGLMTLMVALANPQPSLAQEKATAQNQSVSSNGVKHQVEDTYKTTMSRTGKTFTRWLMLNDKLGAQHFYGSITVKSRGSSGVSSILIKARGKDSEDYAKTIHKIREGKPGEEIFNYRTREGVTYSVRVNPDSSYGKTFDVSVKGDLMVDTL